MEDTRKTGRKAVCLLSFLIVACGSLAVFIFFPPVISKLACGYLQLVGPWPVFFLKVWQLILLCKATGWQKRTETVCAKWADVDELVLVSPVMH